MQLSYYCQRDHKWFVKIYAKQLTVLKYWVEICVVKISIFVPKRRLSMPGGQSRGKRIKYQERKVDGAVDSWILLHKTKSCSVWSPCNARKAYSLHLLRALAPVERGDYFFVFPFTVVFLFIRQIHFDRSKHPAYARDCYLISFTYYIHYVQVDRFRCGPCWSNL